MPPPAEGVVRQRPTLKRRHELDGLRTFVVVGLVFFHTALVFDANDDYYVKNAHTTEVTTYLAALAIVWAMPMLVVIARISTWHSLHNRRTATPFL